MIYDSVIIGTGPAGISAALNLKIREKEFLLIGNSELSEKMAKAESVQNYPGFFDTSGRELKAHLRYQLECMEIEITEQMVTSIKKYGDTFAIMAGAEFYEAKTVILATGMVFQKTLEGEDEYLGKGVSYCATCDGSLYRGRKIAVLCNNARFEHEVKYLAGLAETVEYYPNFLGFSEIGDNVNLHVSRVKGIKGENRVSGLVTDEGEVPVDGVFILRDTVSIGALIPGLETEEGHIAVDRSMATNIPGVFACGDCTGRPYQIAKAVGEGNVAAHSALDYLAEMEK